MLNPIRNTRSLVLASVIGWIALSGPSVLRGDEAAPPPAAAAAPAAAAPATAPPPAAAAAPAAAAPAPAPQVADPLAYPPGANAGTKTDLQWPVPADLSVGESHRQGSGHARRTGKQRRPQQGLDQPRVDADHRFPGDVHASGLRVRRNRPCPRQECGACDEHQPADLSAGAAGVLGCRLALDVRRLRGGSGGHRLATHLGTRSGNSSTGKPRSPCSAIRSGSSGNKGFFSEDWATAISIPRSSTLFLFQVVFMDTAATIPTGTMAERWNIQEFHASMACGSAHLATRSMATGYGAAAGSRSSVKTSVSATGMLTSPDRPSCT